MSAPMSFPKILVVEDDVSIRETLSLVLEACHFEADLVEDGEQALEYLKTRWPDVMLLDLTLPGMTGEEVYREIGRRFARALPTIVLTAAQEGASRARALPGARFLAKPYTIEELCDLIAEMTQTQAA